MAPLMYFRVPDGGSVRGFFNLDVGVEPTHSLPRAQSDENLPSLLVPFFTQYGGALNRGELLIMPVTLYHNDRLRLFTKTLALLFLDYFRCCRRRQSWLLQ